MTEGLQPWQPKKLYYFSDASHTEFQEHKGPRYSTDGESPARKMPYYRLAAEEMSYHLTQGDTGQAAKQAIEKGDYKVFLEPVRLILGKSLVGGEITGDVFQAVKPGQYRSPRRVLIRHPHGTAFRSSWADPGLFIVTSGACTS